MRDVLLGLYPELAAMEVAAEERGGGGDGSQTAKNAYRGMHVEFEGLVHAHFSPASQPPLKVLPEWGAALHRRLVETTRMRHTSRFSFTVVRVPVCACLCVPVGG